jgi:hypothetical protein
MKSEEGVQDRQPEHEPTGRRLRQREEAGRDRQLVPTDAIHIALLGGEQYLLGVLGPRSYGSGSGRPL